MLLYLVVGYISVVVRATYSFQHSFQQLNSGFKKKSILPPAAFQLHGAHVTFVKPKNFKGKGYRKLASQRDDEQTKNLSSFTATDSSTKGFVSTATNLLNSLNWINKPKGRKDSDENKLIYDANATKRPPATVEDLMLLLRKDYEVNNYLWTGELSVEAFTPSCIFTDPTISFQGTSTYINNLQSLIPIVNWLTRNTTQLSCQSLLLSLDVDEAQGYVESRWNMVGELCALPWRPRINVVGRTKFWYKYIVDQEDGEEDGETAMHQDSANASRNKTTSSTICSTQVFFYDESWEIPASQALLQLITPTTRNTMHVN